MRAILATCQRTLLAGLLLVGNLPFFVDCDDGGPAPDQKFDDHSVAAADSSQMEHSVEEMIAFVRENYSQSLADDMEADLTGDDPCVEVVEVYTKDGHTDATTIGVRTRG